MDLESLNIAGLSRYLSIFFAEKELPYAEWDIEDGSGWLHSISNELVVEHIAIASRAEQDKIASVIRKIDAANGDVNHFLKHLAHGLIAQQEQN